VGLLLAAFPLYEALNHGPAVVDLHSAVDTVIPLFAPFVVPYLSFFGFIGATTVYLLLFDLPRHRSLVLAMLGTLAVSLACYVAFQSSVARPALVGDDPFTRLLAAVYAADRPFNAFPSLHAGLTTVCVAQWWRARRPLRAAGIVWAALILASTVLVKQHYAADLGAGVVLGAVLSAVVSHRVSAPTDPPAAA